ncbi:MAG TPA: PAS domain S-box protein, partial [Usitatibacteraceae bacterium]|nr:PAS domain S-box protein [Usitatibacteraceae bacterium]
MSFAHRLSLKARVVLLMLAIVVPFGGVLAGYIANEYAEARTNAYRHAEGVAAISAARLSLKLGDLEAILSRLAERPSIRALDPERCDPIIDEYVRLHPEFTTLALRDRDGNIACSFLPGPIAKLDPGKFPWFGEGLRNAKFTAGNAFLGHQTGKWVSVLTQPVRDDSGRTSGLLVMAVELLPLSRQIFEGVPENLLMAVVDREGKVLLRSRDHEARVGKAIPAHFVEQTRGRDQGNLAERGTDGVRRLYAFTTIPGTGWRVFAALDEKEALATYRRDLLAGVALGIPLALLVLASAWWVGSAIANPIRSLARTAERVAEGDTNARAPIDGPAEIRSVARQFNRMLDSFERHREERAALVGHFGQLAKVAPEIILLIDPDGRIVEANDAAAAAYGYGVDELRGMHILDLRTPVDAALLAQQLQAADSPGGVLFETFHRRKDGSTFPVEVSARSLEIGGKLYRQSFVRDITARRQAEDAIRESEVRFRTVVESAPDGIFIQTGGRFAWLNREAMRIFGIAGMEAARGQPVAERFHPDSRELARARIRLVNEERRSVHLRGRGRSARVRARHHRPQARPGGTAQERVPLPHAGGGRADHRRPGVRPRAPGGL